MDATLTELTGGFAARQLPTSRPTAEPGAAPTERGPDAIADVIGSDSGDSIRISAEAEAALAGGGPDNGQAGNGQAGNDRAGTGEAKDASEKKTEAEPGAKRGADGEPLSDEDRREVERLEKRDQEVRTHEQAHQSAGGAHAGSPSYEYETGPDGKQYATSGEVPIDTSAVSGDPQATIDKMEQVKRAALAPAEPSAADRAIAARADQAKLRAQQELREQQTQGADGADGPPPPGQAGTEPGARPGTGPQGPNAEDEAAPPASYAGRGSLLSVAA